MSPKPRQDLISHLRAMDEHWGQVTPDPAFEQRLLLNLQPIAKKKSEYFWIFTWFRRYARPLVLVAAAAVVLILSVSDNVPNVRSGLIVPQAPDAAVEPVETPRDERFEPANPHFDQEPQDPRNAPVDPSDPRRNDLRRPDESVLPVHPDQEGDQEQTLVEPKFWNFAPDYKRPKSTSRESSDFMHFWAPGQTMPSEMQSRSPNNPGQWGNGNSSSRPKPQTTTSMAPCYTQETLKKRAAATCEQGGLVLSDIVYINPCKDGLFQHAEHECAESAPEEDSCTTGTVSDGDQCVDPGQLKNLAYTACKMAMMDLVDFTYSSGDCGWKTRNATYTCCPVPTPDPPPSPPPVMVCQSETIGDGVTCMDPGKIKEDAYYYCQNLGLNLAEIWPAPNCADGQSSLAKITCCGP
jgi:hypothetical protein